MVSTICREHIRTFTRIYFNLYYYFTQNYIYSGELFLTVGSVFPGHE